MKYTSRILALDDIRTAGFEIEKIGSSREGTRIMSPKSVFKVVKVKDIKTPAANILKQEMLSLGGESANAYQTINCRANTTDVLLMGTLAQFEVLIKKLKRHPFDLPRVAESVREALKNYQSSPAPLQIGQRTIRFGKRTYIMGILNVTPDSFSDGGKFMVPEKAAAQAERMIKEGADIIDVGGESTRPGASFVPVKEELRRVIPVIKLLKNKKTLISIDTRKAQVAREALKAGAHIINDVSALLYDRNMAKVAARFKAPIILMHMKGTPAGMQKRPSYQDLFSEIIEYFSKSIAIAGNAGILSTKIILDPGIGFGKTVDHNLELLKNLKEFRVLGKPILVGTSRKSLIGLTLGLPADQRLEGTAATTAVAISGGADIIRVHDVKAMKRVAKMTDAITRRS